ncbi:MAG TPA: DUF3108 domain-containing protein [Alphaproteobacteria bacterium]|nr:DUF3108 domain-containing protein [Alphaproteobacteria bacterium]
MVIVLVFALATTVLAAAWPAGAAPKPTDAAGPPGGPIAFEARLGVFYAGFLVYSGSLVGRIAEGRYTIAYQARSRGLLRLVASMETRNEVFGVLRDGRFRAVAYRDRIRWREKRTAVQVAFGPGGAERTTSVPPFAARNRRPIPISASRGATDPLTTLLAGMAGAGGAAPCNWTHRVYDGRRLVRVDTVNLGHERLLGDGLTMYRGPAIKCRVRFTTLADTRRRSAKRKKTKADAERDQAVFWMARFKRPDIWLPVRARGWSRVGAVHAGLTYFKIGGAAKK